MDAAAPTPTPDHSATGWFLSHSVRMRLTVWYVTAMIVVLGVYVFAVNAFVARSVSDTLDQQLRQDFAWVVASLEQTADGEFMLNEPEQIVPDEALPWVQVWSADRSKRLFRNAEALRRPVPGSQS